LLDEKALQHGIIISGLRNTDNNWRCDDGRYSSTYLVICLL